MFTDIAQQSTQQAILRVRQFRAKKGWTLNRFAKEAGLRESTLRNMDAPTWRPELETLRKLEQMVADEEQQAAQ